MENKKDVVMEGINNAIKEINKEYKIKGSKNYFVNNDDLDTLEDWLFFHFSLLGSDYENMNCQICLTIKDRLHGEFRNKFFNYSKLEPKRDSTAPLSYIIYKLSRIDNYEVWIASNIFKQGGKDLRRTQERVLLSNVLYVDIDEVEGSEDLDYNNKDYNKKLVELLYKNYPIAKIIPPSDIVASGSGLHLYFYINPVLLTSESRFTYIECLRDLTKLYNGDSACVDISRILRPPSTFNKKEKFYIYNEELEEKIITPKKVELVEKNEESYTLTNIYTLLMKYKKELKDTTNNKKSKKGKNTQATQAIKKQKRNCNDNFDLQPYEENENYPNQYLVQDLLYFMKNRDNDCEGVRHNLLFCFYFAFRKYCLMGLEETETNIELINKSFKQPLTEKELFSMLEELKNYNFYNGITNVKVKEMIHMLDREIYYMRGIYANSQEERKQLKLKKDRRIKKEKYINKKPTRTEIMICILNNPMKTNVELANILNISTKTIQRVKKDLYE